MRTGTRKTFEKELSAVAIGGNDGGESVVRSLSYVRLSPQKALDLLDMKFDPPYKLSTREREVAILLLDRFDYGTISEKLDISVNTVKTHAKTIYNKCDVSSRKELIQLSTELS
ncbi:hypothetical protein MASR2M78_35720 [Treponema sp.]